MLQYCSILKVKLQGIQKSLFPGMEIPLYFSLFPGRTWYFCTQLHYRNDCSASDEAYI